MICAINTRFQPDAPGWYRWYGWHQLPPAHSGRQLPMSSLKTGTAPWKYWDNPRPSFSVSRGDISLHGETNSREVGSATAVAMKIDWRLLPRPSSTIECALSATAVERFSTPNSIGYRKLASQISALLAAFNLARIDCYPYLPEAGLASALTPHTTTMLIL